MKKLENILYINSNGIETSLFKALVGKKFKIYDYSSTQDLSNFIIDDLNADIILLSDDLLDEKNFVEILKDKKNLYVMSSKESSGYSIFKMPVEATQLCDKLEELYRKDR